MENEVFLWCTIISGLFGIIMLLVLQVTWRHKELFKIKLWNIKKKNELDFKKYMKDSGLDFPSSQKSPHLTSAAGGGLDLLSLAKTIPPESLAQIVDILQGRASGETGEGSIVPEGLEGLVDFAVKNPDIVKSFMDGIKGNAGENAEATQLL